MKGQSSVEIIVVIMIIFFLAIFINFLVIQPQNYQSSQVQNFLAAKTVCEGIADNVQLVSQGRDGFSTTIEVPQTLNFLEKINVTVFPGLVVVDWSNNTINCQFRVKRVLLKLSPARSVKIAYLGKETCLYNAIQRFSPYNFCNAIYQDVQGCSNYCKNWTVAQRNVDHNKLMNNLSAYDVFFFEDPHFTDGNITIQELFYQSKISYGFYSEHIQGGGDIDMFGATYKGGSNNGNATVIAQDDIMELPIGTQIQPVNTPTMDSANVTKIAVYSDGDPAISGWNYGKARLYHLSDLDIKYFRNFTELLMDSLNVSLTFLASYQGTPFSLNDTSYRIYNDNGDVVFE